MAALLPLTVLMMVGIEWIPLTPSRTHVPHVSDVMISSSIAVDLLLTSAFIVYATISPSIVYAVSSQLVDLFLTTTSVPLSRLPVLSRVVYLTYTSAAVPMS